MMMSTPMKDSSSSLVNGFHGETTVACLFFGLGLVWVHCEMLDWETSVVLAGDWTFCGGGGGCGGCGSTVGGGTGADD